MRNKYAFYGFLLSLLSILLYLPYGILSLYISKTWPLLDISENLLRFITIFQLLMGISGTILGFLSLRKIEESKKYEDIGGRMLSIVSIELGILSGIINLFLFWLSLWIWNI